jgi:hypothetical protein
MNYKQEKDTIELFFTANWPHTPVVFENAPASDENEWVRLSIQNGRAFQASMGDNPAFRYPGVVFVQIFTAKDVGSGRALELADLVDALFKIAVVSGIQFKVPRINKVPSDGPYQVNVSIDFYRGS